MEKMKRIVALILAVLIVLSVASYLFYLLEISKKSPLAGQPARGAFLLDKNGKETAALAQSALRDCGPAGFMVR